VAELTPVQRSLAISEAWNSLGGHLIREILEGMIRDPKEQLFNLVSSSKCESATGKTGIRLGSRARALEDFKETVEDEIRAGTPQPRIGAGE